MTYGETTDGQTIGRLLSEHPDLDPSAGGALDNVNQFRIGGADAVGLLIGGLALAEGDRALDIGSGFGGPARQIARRTGNRVTGIDITPAHVNAARDLTARAGLRDLVEFRMADIASSPPAHCAPRSSRPASPPPSGRTKRPGSKPGSPGPSRTACPPDQRCRCS